MLRVEIDDAVAHRVLRERADVGGGEVVAAVQEREEFREQIFK